MIDLSRFTHLTFDCYGTLIDWETGILEAFRAMLGPRGLRAGPERVLRLYAECEAREERGPYRPYREVLRGVARSVATELGHPAAERDLDVLPDSVGRWEPFPDTVESLRRLASRFKLAVISNIDDAMFSETARRLQVEFETVVTAEQVGAYKPSKRNFLEAIRRTGAPRERILHVAQSLYHDHAPAKQLGLITARINRASLLAGTGVAPGSAARPDVEFDGLDRLADAMGV